MYASVKLGLNLVNMKNCGKKYEIKRNRNMEYNVAIILSFRLISAGFELIKLITTLFIYYFLMPL